MVLVDWLKSPSARYEILDQDLPDQLIWLIDQTNNIILVYGAGPTI